MIIGDRLRDCVRRETVSRRHQRALVPCFFVTYHAWRMGIRSLHRKHWRNGAALRGPIIQLFLRGQEPPVLPASAQGEGLLTKALGEISARCAVSTKLRQALCKSKEQDRKIYPAQCSKMTRRYRHSSPGIFFFGSRFLPPAIGPNGFRPVQRGRLNCLPCVS